MSKKQITYELVEDGPALVRLADALQKERAVAVDLEADSMFHYQEKVCLIQISTTSRNILIDPLFLDDLSPLAPVFSDPDIRKVFHGADYDIRSLYRDFAIEVNGLFDTQIAARFLGTMETSLAHILKERLGVHLEKKYQKRDWSIRPLPSPMLDYAVQDTAWLLPLSRILEEQIRNKGRLLWVEEECRRLSRVRPAPPDSDPLFLKFNGARRLDPRGLAVLESILKLRDEQARRKDRPPFKVLGNEPIMEIAELKPVTKKDLERIKRLSAGQLKALGRVILGKTKESLTLQEDELPSFPRSVKPRTTARVSRRIKALKSWKEQRAKEMGLDPALVCTNAQIEALALAYPKSRKDLKEIDSMRTWQIQMFGKEICSLLKDLN